MEGLPINIADAIVLVVLLLSGLLAFARGFVKELLSIVGWVGSILITFHLFPLLSFLARERIETRFIADTVTVVTIFVVALIAFSMVAPFISKRVKASGMSFLDRTLGLVFGLARGAVVVCLAYLLLVWLVPPEDHPDWVREARALPLVMYGSQQLKRLAPEATRAEVEAAAEAAGKAVLEPLTFDEVLKRVLEPGPRPAPEEPADTGAKTGYKKGERKQLERLFESQETN